MNLTAIAIDDEPIALDIIRKLALQVPFLELEKSFTNAFEAIGYLKCQQPDLIFLDIKMPDISGIALMEGLPGLPMVIYHGIRRTRGAGL